MLFWRAMARVQLLMPDEDHARFTFRADIDRFFAECDAREDPGVEPDWEQHLSVIGESRRRGAAAE